MVRTRTTNGAHQNNKWCAPEQQTVRSITAP